MKDLISKIAIVPNIVKVECGLLINTLISKVAYFFNNNLSAPLPINNANVINISNPRLSDGNDNSDTLSIKWFGSGNYEIGLGKLSIFTDPFVTYYKLTDIKFSHFKLKKLRSNETLVKSAYGSLESSANAIFVGHSHYDHILDVSELLKLPGWEDTSVYGSKTAGHILAGYNQKN